MNLLLKFSHRTKRYKSGKDVEEIQAAFIKGLKFHFVQTMDEVLDFALEPKSKAKTASKKIKTKH